MKKAQYFLFILTAALTLSSCVYFAATPASVDGTLPHKSVFVTEDLNGNEVDDTVFGVAKLTMMNVWATYCGPCLWEMPYLGKLAKAYQEKGVQIIGVVTDVTDGTYTPVPTAVSYAKSLVSKTGASYRHLLLSETLDSAYLSGVTAVPTTFFFDRDGNVIGEPYVGTRSYEAWQTILESLLAEVSE